MKVFISWSGSISQQFAAALADWLPNVIQAVKPFYSSDDIRKGARWFTEISSALDETNFGILCVTPDNMTAPWLLFEAGALAKKVQHSRVTPLLLSIESSQLAGPLTQFQATEVKRDDVLKLVASINEALDASALTATRLNAAFDKNWGDLERAITAATEAITKSQKSTGTPKRRDTNDMLEELLDVTRGIGRQMETIRTSSRFSLADYAGSNTVVKPSMASQFAAQGVTILTASSDAPEP
jgi:hypothetical protein